MDNILTRLVAERGWLLADGATGTNMFALGLAHGDAPELWNIEKPEMVRAHYRAFLDVGSDLVLTNSFGGTANRLQLHGLADRVHEINKAAAALLRQEIDACGREVVCAGSVGPTGDLFEPIGPLTVEDGAGSFAAQMQGLKDGGADVVWIETLSATEEIEAALIAADRVGIPAVCTLSFDTNGRTMMGITPERFVTMMHEGSHRPVAFGGNCGTGAPDLLTGLISMRGRITNADIVVAKANCGIPEYREGAICYSGTAALMAAYAVLARDCGARIIGGCCGTTPEHVAAMKAALDTTPPGEPPTIHDIIDRIGALTGTTASLLDASAAPVVPAERRRRRRA